ncbi:TPA: hypothetical protein H5X26_005042 [Escherichia coli]|nr:hypothetical protein [Escherichia coli]
MIENQTIDGVPREITAAIQALTTARQFIVNGVDLGFIRMPDAETPDPAHGTVPMLDKVLAELRALLDAPAECRCERYGKGNPHWPCPVHAAPSAQPKGEPGARLGTHHVLGAIHNVPGFPGVKGNHIQDLTVLLNGVLDDAEQSAATCNTPGGLDCPGDGVGACKKCPASQPLGEIDLTPKRLAHAENVIERQNNLITSLRAELSESYRIGAKPQGARKKALLAKPWPVVMPDQRFDWYAADDVDRHVRTLDVMINGEEGASPQAKLCDLVAQLQAKPVFGLDPAKGYALVPIKPSPGLLMSMAIRSDHGLGVPGYYDTALMLKGGHGITHARRVECALSDMRKLYEEVVGVGFYSVEKEAEYAAYAVPEGFQSDTPV